MPMSKTASHSTRFTRAARAESARLLTHQQKAAEEISRLEQELAAAKREFARVADRIEQLRTITGEAPVEAAPAPVAVEGTAISGAQIRQVAVEVLLDSADSERPIHYREWLELLERSGYQVQGKRPDAVFLGQIVRSPVIRATSQAGYYALDLEARERLLRAITAAQQRVLDLSASRPKDGEALDRLIEERDAASAEVRKLQKELSEAFAVLGDPGQERAEPISRAAA
jgi:hypothetical protein